ncbi:hypothetical protein KCU61_g6727, partial [Aureobasidium melanogenum]
MVGNSDSATTFTSMAAQPASNEASSLTPVFDLSSPDGPVRQAVHSLSSQQYPFMDDFDPLQSSSLDFDPFNMNQDAAFASNSIGTYLAPSSNDFPETFDIDDLLSSDLFDMTK